MRIQLIAKPDSGMTGTSRYTSGLYQGLREAGVDVRLTFPEPPPVPAPVVRGLRRLGMDLRAFFASYPLRAYLDDADVYHITTQTMATLLWFQRIHPVIVTVHDIIPYLVRHDAELNTFRHPVDYLFYRLALVGLRRADALIAVSESTKRTLVEALGLPAGQIHVIHEAVDHEKFHPMAVPDPFHAKYKLDKEGRRYVLYVGSDDPRKNLRTLVQAFAMVRQQAEDAKLLKVGLPCFAQERARLLALVAELELQECVLFFEHVPDEDLALFYNVADVFVMPSLYEGFGLPVLEAMACGKPVIISDRGALPEVGGSAALTVNPTDIVRLAAQITHVLEDQEYAHALGQAAYQRAQTFQSARQAEATLAIYTGLEKAK